MDQLEGFTVLPGMAGRVIADQESVEVGKRHGIIIPISAVFSPKQFATSYVWVFDESAATVSQREGRP